MIVQLKSSKISIKNLFKDLLIELRGFKYQITLCVLLSKVKSSDLTDYLPVYFNTLTKILVINILLISVLMRFFLDYKVGFRRWKSLECRRKC